MRGDETVNLFLEMDPPTSTSQENKTAIVNGRIMHYKSKGAKQTFSILTAALRPFAPAVPMDGPIHLTVIWKFRSNKTHKPQTWRITRPDTDNLQKALKDVMTRLGYWVDDSRVCCESVSKIWSDRPGIDICIKQLPEGNNGKD
jgi:Holliday junction resolvase RusA-like endonuclease